ncbi:MAG: hypothetical protein KQ78_00026 [Candidatus Izimaplasma bacterium HR2]|nr:MAG: hypothetical protein KQ78_00026 [Candidatus Izimaplasma bacterium HR2]
MERVDAIEIPETHISFAHNVAILAEKNGIKSFTLRYVPDWNEPGQEHDRRVKGDAIIEFSAMDGRGRPCRQLSINFDARISHIICSEPNSYD